jgi:hypothetical protein
MLVCSTFETKLDLSSKSLMRENLVAANLIEDKTEDRWSFFAGLFSMAGIMCDNRYSAWATYKI